jgi:hypothetical protein
VSRTLLSTCSLSNKKAEEAEPLLHHLHHLNYLSQPLPLNLNIQIYLSRSPHLRETSDQGILFVPRRPGLASVVDFEVAKAKASVLEPRAAVVGCLLGFADLLGWVEG